MSPTVHTCHPHDSLERAAHMLWDFDIGAMPVVDFESKLVGVITDRDICMAAFTQGKPLASLRVEAAMALQHFAVHARDPIAAVARIMRERQVHRVPVIDAQMRVVGMVTINDLARESLREPEKDQRAVSLYDVVVALAEVNRPRNEPAVEPAASQRGDVEPPRASN